MKSKLVQPYLITLTALIFTFLFFVFREYYKPVFAIRIFIVDVFGLLGASIGYYLILPNHTSVIKRPLLIVFTYFTVYELIDYLTFFIRHGIFSRGSRTDLVEAETAVITFIMTFLFAGMVKLYQSDETEKIE
jgi:hypothetical protein